MKHQILTIIAAVAVALGAHATDGTTAANSANTQHPAVYYNTLPRKGYHGQVGLEMMAPGAFQRGSANLGISTVHGAMLTWRHFLGAGAAYLYDFSADQALIPVFAEGRIYFPSSKARIYPYVDARAGVAFATQGGSGLYGALALGLRVPVGLRYGLSVELGPQIMPSFARATPGAAFTHDGSDFAFFARINFGF
jgi:hypothetical protein